MSETRRGFLSKLGIGSLVISAAGIFKVTEEQLEGKPLKVEQLNEQQITEIAGGILDAMDGKNTNPVIYNAVRAHLTKGTIYQYTSSPEVESIAEMPTIEEYNEK